MIKGILIDFGGTIDSDGIHWFDAFREAYARVSASSAVHAVPDELLKDAYVHTERTLGRNTIITPDTTFYDTLKIKLFLQSEYLQSHETVITDTAQDAILNYCYNNVVNHIATVSIPVLERLSAKYPMVLVTNFYGNMHTVLEELGLSHLFKDVIESSVSGVRKPDPEIFRLGVKALGFEPSETLMIGDSQEKDILPAQSIGCHTILLQGKSRSEVQCTPDHTVSTLQEITF